MCVCGGGGGMEGGGGRGGGVVKEAGGGGGTDGRGRRWRSGGRGVGGVKAG